VIRAPVTIAGFGTSLMTGRLSTSHLVRLQSNLRAVASRPVVVYDVGQGGMTSAWGRANIFRATQHRPNICLFEGFSINDAVTSFSVSRAQSLDNKAAILADLRACRADMKIFLLTMNGVPDPTLRPDLEAYYQDDRDFAAANGLTLLDVRAAWGTPTLTDMPDRLHPIQAAVDRVLLPITTAACTPFVI